MAEEIGWRKYSDRFRTYPMLIQAPNDPAVRMIVCIPVCAEPDLVSTMNALYEGNEPVVKTEVILLFNKNSLMSDDEIEVHTQSWRLCEEWIEHHKKDNLIFLPFYLEE